MKATGIKQYIYNYTNEKGKLITKSVGLKRESLNWEDAKLIAGSFFCCCFFIKKKTTTKKI